MSLSTFYKYAKLLGLSKPLPPHRRKKHCQGIRASRPNKLLHADMTVFKTADNVKAYIYIIMDNYSRKILSWKASLSAKADIAFDCLKEAYETHIAHLPEKETVKLMTDGGSEVNNEMVDSYLETEAPTVHKIIAQQDVSFSNSMIEAVNKIIKYNYLFRQDIPDFDKLLGYLKDYIPNYNNRFHGSLRGLSPNEAYSGITYESLELQQRVKCAQKVRLEHNRNFRCVNH